MSQIIFLDSTPVGLITNPKATPLALQCERWFDSLLSEIIDYGVMYNKLKPIN